MFNLVKRPFDAVDLGEFIEERDGKKVVVQKWEKVTGSVAQHNAQKEALAARILASKLDESAPLGKIEVAEVAEEVIKK